MRLLTLFIFLFQSFAQIGFAQTTSQRKAHQLHNIYDVYDYTHAVLYSGSGEIQESLGKIKAVLANQYYTQKSRTTLTVEGNKLLKSVQAAFTIDRATYDFQYCINPTEKAQTDSTYYWYNKSQKEYSFLQVVKEDGRFRISKLEIGMTADETQKKLLRSVYCDYSPTPGAVVRGKREGLSQIKPNSPILAYDKESDFWQEATFVVKRDTVFLVEYPNKTQSKVNQIVPIEIKVGDLAFYFKDNDWVRVFIVAINGKQCSISNATIKKTVDRKDLYFRINNMLPTEFSDYLFLQQ